MHSTSDDAALGEMLYRTGDIPGQPDLDDLVQLIMADYGRRRSLGEDTAEEWLGNITARVGKARGLLLASGYLEQQHGYLEEEFAALPVSA